MYLHWQYDTSCMIKFPENMRLIIRIFLLNPATHSSHTQTANNILNTQPSYYSFTFILHSATTNLFKSSAQYNPQTALIQSQRPECSISNSPPARLSLASSSQPKLRLESRWWSITLMIYQWFIWTLKDWWKLMEHSIY